MLAYIKESYPNKEINLGYIQSTWIEVIDFVKLRNFAVENTNKRYFFKLSDLAKVKVPELKSRLAQEDDVPELVRLIDKEPPYENKFTSKEAASNFFKGCVKRGGDYANL